MKSAIQITAVAGVLAIIAPVAHAEMPVNAILTIDASDTDNSTRDACDTTPDASFSGFCMGSPPNNSLPTLITGFNGIVLGTAQPASGSHTGSPDGSESPDIDNPWEFFSNTGMHQTTSAVTVITTSGNTAELDFSGWNVTWNAIASIPMGSRAWNDPGSGWDGNVDGVAQVTCAVDCGFGDTYTLEYTATVPDGDPSGFGNVEYGLRLEGRILDPAGAPVANDDTAKTIVDNPVVIDILANDDLAPDPTNVAIDTPPTDGATAIDPADGSVTYTPDPGFTGTDSFTYTTENTDGQISNIGTVDITVVTNTQVVANDDSVTTNTGALDRTPLTISVLDNDEDTDNDPGKPGGIDLNSLAIVTNASTGTCTANADGTITYSQPAPAMAATVTCVYEISDIDSANPPTSDTATVTIEVVATQSDWPSNLSSDIIPILAYDTGIPGHPTDTGVPPAGGSYFSMQLSRDTTIFTVLEPGPAGGLIIGHEQPAGNTHSGSPNGTELASVDQPWLFFANTGMHFTKNGGITGNPDGTLQFHNKTLGKGAWIVTWNGIPEIDMGGDTTGNFPEDPGFATIVCDPVPCADGSTFELEYDAHVPPGDPSGFGGVPYGLRMTGTVHFLDGSLQLSNGTVSSMTRLQASEISTEDPDVSFSCAGNCFEYTITGVTDTRVSVVFPLAGGVPENPVWRILDNGTWRSFDTSTGDSISSAEFDTGTGQCPAAGDAAYGELTAGHQCVQLAISDNGPNDLNAAVGTISDPGGLGSGGTAGGGTDFVDTRTSDTGGCSLGTGRNAGLEWLLIGMLLIGLGLGSRRRA